MKYTVICTISLLITAYGYAQQDDQNQTSDERLSAAGDTIKSQGSSLLKGGGTFLSGIAQSFGWVPSSYTYSFRVFNDTPGRIVVGIQHETNVLGGRFAGDLEDSKQLAAFEETGDYFMSKKLYLRIWLLGKNSDISSYAKDSTIGAYAGFGIGAIPGGIAVTELARDDAFFDKLINSLIQENDPNVYYYRGFTMTGTPQGEYLGIKDVTSEFAGVFYNSLPEVEGNDVTLDFIKSGTSYRVTLEPNSFSLLSSDTTIVNSIRPPSDEPRYFTFRQGRSLNTGIPIASQGIANVTADPQDQTRIVLAGPMTYTYEVWKDSSGVIHIGMQGLSVGKFNQPMGRVRDINPSKVSVWYTSAAQTAQAEPSQDASSVPVDVPETLWVSYKTSDQVVQQKITPGSVVDLGLIRPQISETSTALFFALLRSSDDTASKKFLDRLHKGLIGGDALFTKITNPYDVKDVAENKAVNPNGIIVDDKGTDNSGVTGYVVITDTFFPRGIGTGPYYYQVPSSQLQVGTLANLLYFSKDSYDNTGALSVNVMQDFAQKVQQWITDYPTKQQQVRDDVVNYLKTNGASELFDASGALTTNAQAMVQTFLTGAVSIAKPPIVRQAGTNWYALTMGSVPDGWPETQS